MPNQVPSDSRPSPSPGSEPGLAGRVRLFAGRLSRRLRRAEVDGLPPLQRTVLADLARHGPLRQFELARLEGVRDPTMSRLVTALLQAGWVERAVDEDDARRRWVLLTPLGMARLRSAAAHDTDELRARLARLSPAQHAAIAAALPALEIIATEEPGQLCHAG